MTVDCPSEEMFVMVLAGRADPGTAGGFHRHVETCASCAAVLSALAAAASSIHVRPAVSGTSATVSADTVDDNAGALEVGPGTLVHQYELIRELGRGGMGMVWAARDTRLGRRVAIKFLLNASRAVAERFLVEARATAHCNHENIVIVHEVEEIDHTPYMVLEFLEGQTLRDALTGFGGGMPPSRVIELAVPIARALVRAHELGIVHRDLKPENVFVTEAGQVKVLDFGIAKALGTPGRAGDKASEIRGGHIQLTREGALIGTLPYMSPEQMSAEEVDHRADLWAFGVMLFEMLAGHHPVQPFTVEGLIENAASPAPMPSIGEHVRELPDELVAIVDACLRKPKDERIADAAQLVSRLEQLLPGRQGRALEEGESPYPGLVAFQEADANRFFGRDREVARMVTRIRELPITGIVGPSGAGKSSFVRAGVGPALKASGERWEMLTVRPGRQPLAQLAAAIQRLTTRTGGDELLVHLRESAGLAGTLLRGRARDSDGRILVFVDQFEELYTLVPDVAERRLFTGALAAIADDVASPVRLVVSMRSDFLDRVAEDPAFMEPLSRGLVFLPPPDREGLREALVAPVAMAGHRFESPALVSEMLDALEGTPGALPLLQFAAAKLWDARDRKRRLITMASYQAIGGISGALATHADVVVAAMDSAGQKLTQRIFRRLVTPERTRAIVELADLHELASDRAAVTRVLDQLVGARLLVVQTRGDGAGGSVEIVHESLIDRWPTLRRWLDEDQEDAAFLAQLAAGAKQWHAKGKPTGLLWRGEAMDEARRWHGARPRELPDRDRAFLDAVFALDRRGRRIRRGALVASFVVLGAIAAGATIAAIKIRGAEQAASESLSQLKEADRTRDLADEQKRAEAKARAAAETERERAEQARTQALEAQRTAENTTVEIRAKSAKELADENQRLLVEKQRAERALAAEEVTTKKLRDTEGKLQVELDKTKKELAESEAKLKHVVTKLGD